MLPWRLLHTSVYRYTSVDKASLSKLRKKTGISFINCKKALQKFNNDISEAEKWLKEQAQKEGWTKASKLQDRPMSQGLVGVIVDKKEAVMVEVNCETDFVARNSKFQNLVSRAANVCLNHAKQVDKAKVLLTREEVNELSSIDQKLGDIVALNVGSIGENISIRRAACIKAQQDGQLGFYVHSSGVPHSDASCQMGKYGAIVVFKQTEPTSKSEMSIGEMGQKLGQHVVGMNPLVIGTKEDKPTKNKDKENKLIFQEFLADSTITVQQFLQQNNLEVQDFIRYQCGESLPNDE